MDELPAAAVPFNLLNVQAKPDIWTPLFKEMAATFFQHALPMVDLAVTMRDQVMA